MARRPDQDVHKPGANIGDDQDYTGLPDEELKRAVREHLDADQTVDASEIEVEVEAGRVRLSGRVASLVERETAERIVDDLIGLEVVDNDLRVEETLREGARSADVPNVDVAYGEPGETGDPGSGEQVTGMGVVEYDPSQGDEAALGERIGTEDPMEASDEGRSYTPPDEPQPEAMAATDPAHATATETPWPDSPRGRGRRDVRVDEAIGRALTEAPEEEVRRAPVTENASSFKEHMRETAESRERRRRRE